MEPDGPEEWHVAQERFDEPEEEDPWPDGEPAASVVADGGAPRRRVLGGNSLWVTVAVAVAAAATGVAIALIFVSWPTGAAGNADSGSGGSSGGLPTQSPLSGSGNGTLEVQLVGTVTAVSGTSITIGGNGQPVTATITEATKFAGQVRSAAGIKVGDEVYAVVTGTTSKLTAASIQDPVSGPAGSLAQSWSSTPR